MTEHPRPFPWRAHGRRCIVAAPAIPLVLKVCEPIGAVPFSYQGYALAVTLAALMIAFLVGSDQRDNGEGEPR